MVIVEDIQSGFHALDDYCPFVDFEIQFTEFSLHSETPV